MKQLARLCAILLFLVIVPQISMATALTFGTPTDSLGNPVTGLSSGNEILMYIPLSPDHSGTYGVTNGMHDVGLSVDYATADSAGWMDLYIEFVGFHPNASNAKVIFSFADLDLLPDNDPDATWFNFTETVQFSLWEGTAWTALTNVISDATLDPDIDPLLYPIVSVTGDNDSRDIIFDEFASFLPVSDPLRFKLAFTASIDETDDSRNSRWRNTMESVNARLETSPVPEPSTMLLLGTGLIGLVGCSRRKFVKN